MKKQPPRRSRRLANTNQTKSPEPSPSEPKLSVTPPTETSVLPFLPPVLSSPKTFEEGDEYRDRRTKILKRRAEFRETPKSAEDLAAYERRDNNYEYSAIKGLVPLSLVGKSPPGFPKVVWQKSDTFFTDYAKRNPKNFILSSTRDSLVIGNIASHDIRQYMSKYDPDFKDKIASAGMSYLHFLVIPKKKLYNVVALKDVKIIEKMITHFKQFWASKNSAQKSVDRINLAIRSRAEEVLEAYKKDPQTEAKRTKEFNSLMKQVYSDANKLAQKILQGDVKEKDFFFGFHAAPDHGVGHLHMHVILDPREFRQYSTELHDWKTIPAKAVIDAIKYEINHSP